MKIDEVFDNVLILSYIMDNTTCENINDIYSINVFRGDYYMVVYLYNSIGRYIKLEEENKSVPLPYIRIGYDVMKLFKTKCNRNKLIKSISDDEY